MRISLSRRLVFIVAAGVLGMAAMATPTQAKNLGAAYHTQHLIDCATWLITDPAKHKQYCSPGVAAPFYSVVSFGTRSSDPCEPPPCSPPPCYEVYSTSSRLFTTEAKVEKHHFKKGKKGKKGKKFYKQILN